MIISHCIRFPYHDENYNFFRDQPIITMSQGIAMNNLVNPFDEKAKTWDSDPEKAARARAVADAIAKEVPITAWLFGLRIRLRHGAGQFFPRPIIESDRDG